MIDRFFLSHPRSVGESYAEHFGIASRFGLTMLAGGFAVLVHGFFPALFTTTGSDTVKRLHRMVQIRQTANPEYEI
jgi:hypothetical protein